MLTPEAMLTLAADLTDATADSDAGSLAAIAWRLYGEAGENLAEIGRLQAAWTAAGKAVSGTDCRLHQARRAGQTRRRAGHHPGVSAAAHPGEGAPSSVRPAGRTGAR